MKKHFTFNNFFLQNFAVCLVHNKSEYEKIVKVLKSCLVIFFITFTITGTVAQSTTTLTPSADAFVRNGSYGNTNYGSDTSLVVKSSPSQGFSRSSYLKFSLSTITKVTTAKLRIYGSNTSSTTAVALSAYGIDDDSWIESVISFNNAPAPLAAALGSIGVNDQKQYYELDVTSFVSAQLTGDKTVSFLIKDAGTNDKLLSFNSKDNLQNQPQLVITATTTSGPSNALLFIENPDKFPSNDNFVFSKVQTPWSRNGQTFNANHDSLKVRIHNKGISPLTISGLNLSNTTTWKIEKFNGVPYVPGSGLPVIVNSASFVDLILRFMAVDQATRVKVLNETLTIISNDDINPSKIIYLHGLWQKSGEGTHEPYTQEVLTAFGYKTITGYTNSDPDHGDTTKLKGDEIRPSYFVRANPVFPVSVRQMAAYHGCCTSTETITWFAKGSSTQNSIFTHAGVDGQSLLPRKNSSFGITSGTFNPTTPFGFDVGSNYTDAKKNYGKKIGIRVYKAFDGNRNIIPNSYIISMDYLSSTSNYDYNDNIYFISNVKPEVGSVYFSNLNVTPSALDFDEKVLQTTSTLQLNLSSLGQTYSSVPNDPLLTISSIAITGENKSEFSATMPVKTILNPQEATTLTVTFKPVSQGLKIADLLIYYNNSLSPKRVPLYGIAKGQGVTVTANYRINSGSLNPVTINGKTWSAEQYSFDNLEPYTNPLVTQISATDEDVLYLDEQSSNADKKPFRYELPILNDGDYVVRLHFAEIYWGQPGSSTSLGGGAGSRVMSVKLENQLRLINFDLTQDVGGASAVVKNFPVTVTDGKLNIDFSATVNRPMVSALEVYSFSGSALVARKTDSSAIMWSSTAGVNGENSFVKPKIFPNPVHNNFTIQFPSTYQGIFFTQLVDLLGRRYNIGKNNLKPGGSNIYIDLSKLNLKPGVYFLRINSDSKKTDVMKLLLE